MASTSKPVSIAAAMVLLDECRLRLDDPVEPWLPELADRQVLKRIDGPPAVPIVLAAAVGLAGAYAYRRVKPVGSTLTVLAGAAPVFLALFLVQSPASKLVLTSRSDVELASVTARTPVVLVVFDEFPTVGIRSTRCASPASAGWRRTHFGSATRRRCTRARRTRFPRS
jgi:hypothetical protein